MVNAFRQEQEQLILRGRDIPVHVAAPTSRLSTALAPAGEAEAGRRPGSGPRGEVLVHGSAVDGAVSKILNTDCVLMPVSKVVKSFQKLWPQALIVNRLKNCAEVGLIESHGSIWKLLPCGDGSMGTRVMLQTAVRIYL